MAHFVYVTLLKEMYKNQNKIAIERGGRTKRTRGTRKAKKTRKMRSLQKNEENENTKNENKEANKKDKTNSNFTQLNFTHSNFTQLTPQQPYKSYLGARVCLGARGAAGNGIGGWGDGVIETE